MEAAVKSVRLARGIALRYVEQGDSSGVPVLLLHAWGESRGAFDRVLSALPSWLRVLAMDQRGHGDADKPSTGYELSDFAEDVKEFMEALNIEAAVLVGSSSGGYVAQQVAVSWPQLVTALVLIGSPRTLQGRPAFADEVDRLTDPIDPDWVRDSLTWFTFLHPVPDWYLSGRITDGVRMPSVVWREALTGLTSAHPPTEVGKIQAPTLIIWGGGDELIGLEQQEALSSAIAGSRLLIYPDSGHLVLWEQPGKVAADLVAFITEQQSGGMVSPWPSRRPPSV